MLGCETMRVSLKDVIGLYSGTLAPQRRAAMLEALRDPDSETGRKVTALRRIARTEIDLHRLPGMESIAELEDRLEARSDHAS